MDNFTDGGSGGNGANGDDDDDDVWIWDDATWILGASFIVFTMQTGIGID
jgi:hypothetical protein